MNLQKTTAVELIMALSVSAKTMIGRDSSYSQKQINQSEHVDEMTWVSINSNSALVLWQEHFAIDCKF